MAMAKCNKLLRVLGIMFMSQTCNIKEQSEYRSIVLKASTSIFHYNFIMERINMLAIIYSFLHNRWNLQTLNLSPQLIFVSFLTTKIMKLKEFHYFQTGFSCLRLASFTFSYATPSVLCFTLSVFLCMRLRVF